MRRILVAMFVLGLFIAIPNWIGLHSCIISMVRIIAAQVYGSSSPLIEATSSPWNQSKAFLNTVFLSSVLLFQCLDWVKNNPTSLELSCIYYFFFFHSPYFLSSCHCSLLSWVFAACASQKSNRTVGPMFKTSPLQLQPNIICNQVISVATAKKRYQFCLQSFFLLFLLPGRFWVSPDSKVRSYHLLVQQQS